MQPILAGQADMVIGDRAPHALEHFGPVKTHPAAARELGRAPALGHRVPDAASGFRAFSRRAALRMNVFTDFTYTLETIIQAGKKHIPIAHVPITTNPERRPSRLFASLATYVRRSGSTLMRMYALYEPLRFFISLAAVFLVAGLGLFLRFFVIWLQSPFQTGHVQSLIVAAASTIIGVLFLALGVLADLTAMNRRLLEEIVVNTRSIRAEQSRKDGRAE